MARSVKHTALRSAVEDRFSFLQHAGFWPGDFRDGISGCAMTYHSSTFSITVTLGDHYGELSTDIRPRSDDPTPGAPIDCLYVRAGLGPANAITFAARSRHSLDKALASQAEALKALLPLLNTSKGKQLIGGCRGFESREPAQGP